MVVRWIEKEDVSYNEAEHKYGIAHGLIQKWEQIYLTEGIEDLAIERRGSKSTAHPAKLSKAVEEDLIAENQRPREENAYLKKLYALVLEDERRQRKGRR